MTATVMAMDLKEYISEKCNEVTTKCMREIHKRNWKSRKKKSKKKSWRNGG